MVKNLMVNHHLIHTQAMEEVLTLKNQRSLKGPELHIAIINLISLNLYFHKLSTLMYS